MGAYAFAQAPAARAVGTVKSVSGNAVVITTDAGQEMRITFSDSTRIIAAAPGQADLKNAQPVSPSDMQVGDRIFVKGQSGQNGTLTASSAMVMKKTDVAQKQQAERDEWRRGVGGIVKSIDASTGTITLANSLLASGKPIIVRVTAQTSIKRYAPDSVKFDDAQPSAVDQIKPGDQLRTRGTKNADGTEFNAQAIVSGAFRNIAGTVVSTDAANSSVTVMDLVTKQPVVVHVSNASELHKLPQMMAARIAMRLKGSPQEPGSGESRATADGANARPAPNGGGPDQSGVNREGRGGAGESTGWQGGRGGMGQGGNGNSPAGRGAPDFQQMLSRLPSFSISELNKGDAVMLVATEGGSSSQPTAIKMIAGVEPILTASPNGAGASMILSPWNLGGGEGAAGGDSASQ